MKKFIAYFDYLGFKQFIENNPIEQQIDGMLNNYRDMEDALGLGQLKESHLGMIADMDKSTINCINFSDTVVFWTNNNSNEALEELIKVAFQFNWMSVGHTFPIRGAVVYGELEYVDHSQKNVAGGKYVVNSVFGKGLIQAYQKANNQHWAGSVIDHSYIQELCKRGINVQSFLQPYAKKYEVPYKDGISYPKEYVLNIITGPLTEDAFMNYSTSIMENFARYEKSVESNDVQEKIMNTLAFLKSYCIVDY